MPSIHLSALCLMLFLSVPAFAAGKEGFVDVNADEVDVDRKSESLFARGNVHILQTGVFEVSADEASYSRTTKNISASGNIRMNYQGDLFLSERIVLNTDTSLGMLEKVTMDLKGPGGRGGAEKTDLTGADTFKMENAWFTNCDCDPPPWHLAAKKIDVDREANKVTARHMKLYWGDVPVAYFPWWRHPLNPTRTSGFLVPEFRTSASNGFETEVPYYWNIAPDKDLTVALRPITKRGLMGKVQYRYLGLGYHGELDTQQIYDDQKETWRGLSTFSHDQSLWGWDLSARLETSHTRDFINDFDQKLVDSSTRRLESHLTADHNQIKANGYSATSVGAMWYQDLEAPDDQFTVQTLPFALYSDNFPLRDLLPTGSGLDGRYWRMQRDYRVDSFYQMAGDAVQRVDLAPTIEYQRPLPFGRVSSQVGVRETTYLTQGDPNQTGMDQASTAHREASVASVRLDGQLERSFSGGTHHMIMPSVEYVLNAATDQASIPNYDATLRNFTTSNLFSGELYSGLDRISSARWLNYGVTSRLLAHKDNHTIWESATFVVGQRWAPEGNREYQDGQPFSDIVTSLDVSLLDGLSVAAAARIDPHKEEMHSGDTSVSYAFSPDRYVSLGYHFNQPETTKTHIESGSERIEDLVLRAASRFNDAWSLNQEADYSLNVASIKSWKTKLVYEHSCWRFGIEGGRRLSGNTGDHGGGFIGVILGLEGLGGYGV